MRDIRKLTTWIEVSRKAYAKNIEFFKSITAPGAEISVVIKSNGYGHGMLEVATLAKENSIKTFCVHSIDEAITLRRGGFNDKILILGPVLLNRMEEIVVNDFRLVVYNPETLIKLNSEAQKFGRTHPVHLKLETGTNRQGITRDNLNSFLSLLKGMAHISIEAVYSHFANIEDTTNHDYAMFQINNFNELTRHIESAGFKGFQRHFASSAAAILFKKTHFDMIRLGISQFGLWPSKETFVSYKIVNGTGQETLLHPVMTFKTRIGQIKTVASGGFIGYGCSYQTTRDSTVAIIPVGYSDGYDRRLSNQGYALVNGKRAPIRGRIAMNLTVIDITDIPEANLEDEVVLLGTQGGQNISAEYLADLAGTINYEVVTRLGIYTPRIITD